MLSVRIRDLPSDFQNSAYYRSLNVPDEDTTEEADPEILVPEKCTRLEPTMCTFDDLAHMLRTMLFWGFDQTPRTVWDAFIVQYRERKHGKKKRRGTGIPIKNSCKTSHTVKKRGTTKEREERKHRCLVADLCAQVPDMDKSPVLAELSAINTKDPLVIISVGVRLLTYWHEKKRLILSANLTAFAAEHGHLVCLQYLCELGCFYDGYTTQAATRGGHLNCLQYMHERGCYGRGYSDMVYAISGSHLDCLRYLLEIVYAHIPGGDNWEAIRAAAQFGSLNCLRYLHENGYPWNVCATWYAAEHGHLECLQYMHENGCLWDTRTIDMAAQGGKLNCIRCLREQGCPWSWYAPFAAARNGHLECLIYLHVNGCPCSYALNHGGLDIVPSWRESSITQSITKCLQYLRDNCSEPSPPISQV